MATWKIICHINAIMPYSGVATRIGNEQIAVFRVDSDTEVYAISNYDPFSHAFVLSRGIVGDRNGVLKVASPIFKQNFDLRTGQCLDDENIILPTWEARVVDGFVQLQIP